MKVPTFVIMTVCLLSFVVADPPTASAGWWHHHPHVVAVPAQYTAYAPTSYVPVVQVGQQPAAAQNFGVAEVTTIVGLVRAIHELGQDLNKGTSGLSEADVKALSPRVDQLETAVKQHTSDISELTRSQQDLGNRIDRRLDDIEKRLSGGDGSDTDEKLQQLEGRLRKEFESKMGDHIRTKHGKNSK